MSVRETCLDGMFVDMIALPGYFVSVAALGRPGQSPRRIQCRGFFVMFLLYGIIGIRFEELSERRFLLLALYGSTFLFSNYGECVCVCVFYSLTT